MWRKEGLLQTSAGDLDCGELILPSENWVKMVSGGERLDLLGTPLSLVQLRNYREDQILEMKTF